MLEWAYFWSQDGYDQFARTLVTAEARHQRISTTIWVSLW
jgi:hypothetical protein